MKTKNWLMGCVLMGLMSGAHADGEPGLLETMNMLQTMAHKADLAIHHKNAPLLDFYAHELEEYIEQAAGIETYHGKPVGKLVESMLVPAFTEFETAEESGDWETISQSFGDLVQSCNRCHTATDYGFVRIERTTNNPYMQSFEPLDNDQ